MVLAAIINRQFTVLQSTIREIESIENRLQKARDRAREALTQAKEILSLIDHSHRRGEK